MDYSSYKEKIVIRQEYALLGSFLKELPLHFQHEGETLYDGRNTIKTFMKEGICLNIKSFRKPHLINQLAYAIIRKSKAQRSYEYAQKLLKLNINTPSPIAYIEYSKPLLLQHSFYISEHIDFDGELRILQKGTLEDHKELITQFAKFTAELHNSKVFHFDYSPGNVLFKLVDKNYSFYLVDLNRMEFDKEIGIKKAAHNFRRLWGNDDMITFFAKEYALARNFDTEECISLVLKYRKQFWTQLKKRHPEATPYLEK